LTSKMVEACKASCCSEAALLPGVDLLPSPRLITAIYGKLPIEAVKIGGISDEASARLGGALKYHCMSLGFVDQIPNEEFLVEKLVCPTWLAEPELLVYDSWMRERKILAVALSSAAIASADDILDVVKQQEGKLSLRDDSSQIEMGLLKMLSGEEAVPGCTHRIMQCLPDGQNGFEPEHSLQSLNALKNSASWKISPSSSQSLLNWTLQLVSGLVDEKPFGLATSGALHKHAGAVIDKLHMFVFHAAPGVATAYGPAAVLAILRALESVVETGQGDADALAKKLVQWWSLLPQSLHADGEKVLLAVRKDESDKLKKLVLSKKGSPAASSKGKPSPALDEATVVALAMFQP